ncbi:MAG TPA: FAD-binding oxidoreductase [Acidimicrobiales bacterium]|nr:FAD-binding oxidoreductase [Acidimicrobiales bacterium]
MSLQLRKELERAGVNLSLEDAEREARSSDMFPGFAKWPRELRHRARPELVVYPRNDREVATVLAAASRAGIAVVTFGRGSGVTGGVISTVPHLALDTSLLAGEPELNERDLTVVVGAGAAAGEVERWLNERGYTLGHYPQSLHLASLGGLVATRSTGTYSGWYGGIECLVSGLDIVLSDGTPIQLRSSPRSATGPNLIELFIGSEGTLGIITRVQLRVSRTPEAQLLRSFGFPDLERGLESIREIVARGLRPAVVRLYDEVETRMVAEDYGLPIEHPVLAIIGFIGTEMVVSAMDAEAISTSRYIGSAVDLGLDIGQVWLKKRFDASWLYEGNRDELHLADSIEVGLPWSKAHATYRRIMSRLDRVADRAWAHFSHAYPDGVGTYFVFSLERPTRVEVSTAHEEVWRIVMDETAAVGGTLSHHHGVGLARSSYVSDYASDATRLLVLVSQALDPKRILNPGKFGGGASAWLRTK